MSLIKSLRQGNSALDEACEAISVACAGELMVDRAREEGEQAAAKVGPAEEIIPKSEVAELLIEAGIIAPPRPKLQLTAGQETARQLIMGRAKRAAVFGGQFTLKGYAGTGKTTLMQILVEDMQNARLKVVLTAPTNKAVAVLERKMREAGLSIPCMTIYSLLGLSPGSEDAKRKPKRIGPDKSRFFDVVVCDECSMLPSDVMDFVERMLARKFVLFLGDPAQLPPVGEKISRAFLVEDSYELTEIVRYGGQVLELATSIRGMIETGSPDWSKFQPAIDADDPSKGVFCPGQVESMRWIEDAFTSDEFKDDNDSFRVLAWTNRRVKELNRHIRRLNYGETPTPFVPTERVLVRNPVRRQGDEGEETVIQTNDEATVVSIEADVATFLFDEHQAGTNKSGKTVHFVPARDITLNVWRVVLETRFGEQVETMMAADEEQYERACKLLVSDAERNSARWFAYFDGFLDKITKIQSVYAMTAHTSQGSTFKNVFVDMDDITGNRVVVEMLKLVYVASTRLTNALVLF